MPLFLLIWLILEARTEIFQKKSFAFGARKVTFEISWPLSNNCNPTVKKNGLLFYADKIWKILCTIILLSHLKNIFKLVSCLHNCSDLLWEKMFKLSRKPFLIRGWSLRICIFFEITGTIYLNGERLEQFLKQNTFNLFLFLKVSQIS